MSSNSSSSGAGGEVSGGVPASQSGTSHSLNPQKLTLYSTPWQILRVSLLKGNQGGAQGAGGFTTPQGTQANIERLRTYLGESPNVDQLWRVLNLLNAVRMGNSGQGKWESEHDKLVVGFRDEVQKLYNDLKGKGAAKFTPPTEAQMKIELASASADDLQRVATNLGVRNKLHANSPNRRELQFYLGLLMTELEKRQAGGGGRATSVPTQVVPPPTTPT